MHTGQAHATATSDLRAIFARDNSTLSSSALMLTARTSQLVNDDGKHFTPSAGFLKEAKIAHKVHDVPSNAICFSERASQLRSRHHLHVFVLSPIGQTTRGCYAAAGQCGKRKASSRGVDFLETTAA